MVTKNKEKTVQVKKSFYSNGKLLLTGEYVVLDGAMALAIPTHYGQSLTITTSEKKGLRWKSYDCEGTLWFETTFGLIDQIAHWEAGEDAVKNTLIKVLQQAQVLNPNFLGENQGWEVTTQLDFPRNWGLGTSSTLINNIAQWAAVDAFDLLHMSFGGSGYDIASAQHNTPILYTHGNGKLEIAPLSLSWDFTKQLFFVHLNEKQDSKEGIARYKAAAQNQAIDIGAFSALTQQIVAATTLESFIELMSQHEQMIAQLLQLPMVKQRLFEDYNGLVKSLGAWGGDFVLATGGKTDQDYFRKKGYTTIIPFEVMMLQVS